MQKYTGVIRVVPEEGVAVPWTRAQVASDHLGVPVATLRAWERSTGFRPSGAAAFQEFSPATYDGADIAILQVTKHASELGLSGSALARVCQVAQTLRAHFVPGWSGVCVTSTDGRGWLVGPGVPGPASVDDIIRSLTPPARVLTVTNVQVPE